MHQERGNISYMVNTSMKRKKFSMDQSQLAAQAVGLKAKVLEKFHAS
jgi:hypothetical protein